MNSVLTCAAASAVLLWMCVCTGQEPIERSESQRAAHLARMKELAASIHVYAVPGRKESETKLIPEALLRYSDNTRRNNESSLWIWGSAGRPCAIAAIEFYPNRPNQQAAWLYEIASLSTELIAAECGADLAWTTKQPGLSLATIGAAESPADKPSRRLAQMRDLRKRFTAHERETSEGRIELRPLTSPLHRYEDAASDIVDAAIFSFANGTNPEVLLVLEAHKAKDGAVWRYGLVQMTGAAVVAQLDGKDVWQRREADPPAVRESYVNGWIPAENQAAH